MVQVCTGRSKSAGNYTLMLLSENLFIYFLVGKLSCEPVYQSVGRLFGRNNSLFPKSSNSMHLLDHFFVRNYNGNRVVWIDRAGGCWTQGKLNFNDNNKSKKNFILWLLMRVLEFKTSAPLLPPFLRNYNRPTNRPDPSIQPINGMGFP